MGFFTGGGLMGKIMRNAIEKENERIRREAAREWVDSFNKPHSFNSSSKRWECKFCGMRCAGENRPSVNFGGRCEDSPYGKHSWI